MSTAVYAVASVLAVFCRVLLKRAVVAEGHMHEWQAHTLLGCSRWVLAGEGPSVA